MDDNKTDQNGSSDPGQDPGQTLRQRAEERLQKQSSARGALTPEGTSSLLHELQVHQVELEIQNEELRRAQEEIEASRARYFDLYDLAPVGYLTLSEQGLILEANLTATQMLGTHRSRLTGQPMSRFIFRDDQDIYYLSRKQLFERQAPLTFELRIAGDEGTPFWVQMKAKLAQDIDGVLVWRATLSDITERKQVEQALQESKKQMQYLASRILFTQEKERKRISLEVHDILGSSLSAIKFKAEEAVNHLPQDRTLDISVFEPLKILISLIHDTIEDARRIQADLRPPLLDDLGIKATFSWFCRRFETIYSGIKVEQSVTIQEEEVPEHLKISLFRIAQEAMNNIGKYAKADSVYLGLQKGNGTIELEIRDKGEGFDLESLYSGTSSKKGIGISSMRERVEFTGGAFSIESAKGKGTVIRAVWPL